MNGPVLSTTGSESRLVRVLDDYLAALQKGDAPDKAALLAAHSDLAEDLEACLASLDFIRRAARSGPADIPGGEPSDGHHTTGLLGDFRIIQEAGRGGMGVVYEAEQVSLGRRVALKVLPFAAALDPRQLARFRIEAQAAAQLHHTKIVPVFSVGSERGVYYCAMQFIEGQSLAEVILELRQARDASAAADPRRAGPRSAERASLGASPGISASGRTFFESMARLGVQAAEALEYAHSHGIVHRDIKPANQLLDARGTLWVADFGLARLHDDAGLTMTGDVLGTLRYMSPEQALARRVLIDERTDIYSLGVTLYELLTLRPAFDGRDRQELLRQIAFEEPPTPRRVTPAVPREVETIVLKAMAKEPEGRYATAQELADDLRRFLEHRPIKARRPTLIERAAKWSRRHRIALATMAVVLAVCSAFVARLQRAHVELERSREEGVARDSRLRHVRYAADIRQADAFIKSGHWIRAVSLLRRWRPGPGETDLRNFAWHYLTRQCHAERVSLRGHAGAVYSTAFSSDGRTLVSGGVDGIVRFWDVASGRLLRTIPAPDQAGEVNTVTFSPDGRLLATASDDGKVRIWDVNSLSVQKTIPAHREEAYVRFLPDGQRFLSAGRKDGFVKLWDLATSREIASTRVNEGTLEEWVLLGGGANLATVGGGGHVKFWTLPELTPSGSSKVGEQRVFGLDVSRDGKSIVTGDEGGAVRAWRLPGMEPRREFEQAGHSADIQSVAFLAGDRMIVSASAATFSGSSLLAVWDAATGTLIDNLPGHSAKIWGISVAPDREMFATASDDGTVKIWDTRERPLFKMLSTLLPWDYEKSALTCDGRTLVVTGLVGGRFMASGYSGGQWDDVFMEVRGIDTDNGAERFHHRLASTQAIAESFLTPGGTFAGFRNIDKTLKVWDVESGKQSAAWEQVINFSVTDTTSFIRRIHGASVSFLAQMNPADGRVVRVLAGTEHLEPTISAPDEQTLAFVARDWVHLLDLTSEPPSLTSQCRVEGPGYSFGAGAFSADSKLLAIGDGGGVIQLWDVRKREVIGSLTGHSSAIETLEFSPDGTMLLSRSIDGIWTLWDVLAQQALLNPFSPGSSVQQCHFTRDNLTLVYLENLDGSQVIRKLSVSLPSTVASEEAL